MEYLLSLDLASGIFGMHDMFSRLNITLPFPKDAYLLTLTCQYVTLGGKRNFVNLTKVWKWEDDPGLSKWAQCNYSR